MKESSHSLRAGRSWPRVAFITNLCPHYRRPLFELLAEQMEATFYFFSRGEERYLGGLEHEPGDLPIREPRRVRVAGQPLLVGLERELTRERYDVVVKCINGALMLPHVYNLAWRRKLPFVLWTGMSRHPRTLQHRLRRPLTERIYRGADAIVAYGHHVERSLLGVQGVAADKIFVSQQAVDAGPFEAVDPAFPERADVVFVGRLEESKGVRDLLAAFAALDGAAGRLRLIGVGSLEGWIRGQAGSERRVELLGGLGRDRIAAELARARCLVLPSVTTDRGREPWGLVVNEAMAAGIPVVATDAVGAAAGGLVRDGRNGFIVPERRPDALAGALRRLIEDRELARSLGAQARADVEPFNYPRMAQAFTDAIEHAIEPRKARPRPRPDAW